MAKGFNQENQFSLHQIEGNPRQVEFRKMILFLAFVLFKAEGMTLRSAAKSGLFNSINAGSIEFALEALGGRLANPISIWILSVEKILLIWRYIEFASR